MKTNRKKEKTSNPSSPKIKLKYSNVVNDLAEEIFNTVREPLLLLDEELRIVKASRSFYDFFKVDSGETIGNLVYDLGNRQWDIPKLRELLETILPEKTTFDNYEVEHDFFRIGKRVMLLNARKIPRGFWEEQMILLAIEDITERKHKEKSLSEKSRLTEEYLDILLNHAHVPIIIWDSTSVIKRFNHEFEKLSGYDFAEVDGKNIDILFPEDKIDSTLEIITKSVRENILEIYEVDILTKDKKIKTVIWNSANIFDKEGKNIVATIAQDITKRKHSEDALSILETRYRRLFETAKDGILILDSETGKIIDVNPFLIELLGYSKEELLEKEIWAIGFFKDIAANKDKFLELQHKEYVRYENLPLETANGRKINVEFVSNVYSVNQRKVVQCNIRDVTKRKLAEEALRKNEEKYRNLIDNMNEGIFIADEKGLILFANNALARIHGFDSHYKLLNKNIMEFVEPSVRNKMLKNFENEIQSGKSANEIEMPIISAGGSTAYVLIKPSVTRDGARVTGISGIVRDITEQKKSEQKVRGSEKRFRTIFDQAPIGISLLDMGGQIIIANSPLSKMVGYSTDELKKMKFIDFTYHEDIEMDMSLFTDLIEGKISRYNAEKRFVHKNGNLVWVNIFVAMLREESGIPREILGMAEDITERKRAEGEITMLAHSLKSIGECVSITDMEDRILFVNSSFLKTYGYDDNELIGKNMSIVRSPNNNPELVEMILPATLRGGWSGELLNLRKDGSEFPLSLSTTIIHDAGNNPLGLIGVATDITERKRDEKELIEAKFRAEESDKLKSEFLAQMSHEIRTPLNAIVGNVDFLHESFGEKMDAEARGCFDGVDQASKRIIRTVDLILNSAELQMNGYQPHFVKLDLDSEILDKLCREHQLSANKKGLEIIYTCDAKNTKVIADEYSITQVFTNLIDNAIKYTKNGKIKILLTESITGNVIVLVNDTGIGISVEFLKKLFKPFTQEEQGYTRSYDGNGLGLALAKNYCDINNASIEVESEKNSGSTFKVIFN